jgi:serine/threonine-protein kinase
MGVVYLARDTHLGRTVAIKVADDPGADDRSRTRLLHEARNASTLNHPNICTIYEVGEANGQSFIVMEHVEGRSLGDIISAGGLPADTVVRYGTQIADAVAHAHDHGVVHRDLKPANVLITPEGRAKVLDFGLAKRSWHEGAANQQTVLLTRPGTLAGTVAYMPPEVLQGAPADARSDIWSLGALLYELATGVLPFGGATGFDITSRILRDPPRPLPSDVPPGVAATISRCLMKDPAQRYQRAGEVRAALQASETTRLQVAPERPATALTRRNVLAMLGMIAGPLVMVYFLSHQPQTFSAIAVVPFVNVGGDPDTEYLADGVTESVIDSLAQLPQSTLRVIALNSVLRYKRREIDPQTVGRDLNVGAVVIGRVVLRADVLSVSAELVNVRDNTRMWGTTVRTAVANLLTVQDEIATRVSDNLRLKLDAQARSRLTRHYTDNAEAHQLYLKGRYFWNKYTEEGWNKAIDYFSQAINLDPTYALAWAGTADSYYQLSSLVLPPSEAIPKARAAAMKALELDEGLAEAHASLGIINAQYDWNRADAEKEFRRALELNPNYATAHQWYGMYLYADGQFGRALAEFEQAQKLDPLSLIIAVTAAWPLPQLGEYDRALRELQKIMELYPEATDVADYFHELRGDMYLQRGNPRDALEEYLKGFRMKYLCGDDPETHAALRHAYEVSGLNGYWQKELVLATQRYRDQLDAAKQEQKPKYISPYRLAELAARLGDKEQAFAWLQRCYEARDESLVWIKAELLSDNSPWKSLRSDPRFTDLLRRLGLETR